MILRPSLASHRVVGKYTGKVLVGLGFLMLIPLVVALFHYEWNTAFDFVIGFALCMTIGFGAQALFRTDRDLTWSEGFVVAAGSWIWATLLAAVPFWLSGHFASYLDASFDAMSGLTTAGMYLLQDLDHLSNGMNMWRHVLTYVGGQGIVVVALTFLLKGTAGAYKMYIGEGREERVLPNVVQTARAIWLVSFVYLGISVIILTINNWFIGISGARAILMAFYQFCGAWSTGGFAPYSYNAMYYHSLSTEILLAILMIAGSINFAVHWALWTGKFKAVRRNLEIITFSCTLFVLTALCIIALARAGAYPDAWVLGRKAIFGMISAHTTTGFAFIPARSYIGQWGIPAMTILTIAMMLGGSAVSTAGGIKAIRVGIFFKALGAEIKRSVMPESALIRTKYHHIRETYLTDGLIKSTLMIIVLFLVVYLSSGVIGTFYGYSFSEALFEGVGALSSGGLSTGILNPGMPEGLKILFIFYMWFGRFEFMSIFAVIAYAYAVIKGR